MALTDPVVRTDQNEHEFTFIYLTFLPKKLFFFYLVLQLISYSKFSEDCYHAVLQILNEPEFLQISASTL